MDGEKENNPGFPSFEIVQGFQCVEIDYPWPDSSGVLIYHPESKYFTLSPRSGLPLIGRAKALACLRERLIRLIEIIQKNPEVGENRFFLPI